MGGYAMTTVSPTDADLKNIFVQAKTVAVVGLSTDSHRDSYRVAEYLKKKGYRIIPVNPKAEEILGEKSYPDLKSIKESVDVVDVFRRPEYLPEIAEQAVSIGARVLWMQMGIRNDEATRKARSAGLTVIEDRCMMQEYSRVMG
jgi:hypothetical protein